MNLEEIKKNVASKPDLAKRSIIIELTGNNIPNHSRTDIVNNLSPLIGDENIENFEMITNRLGVITLHEGLEHLLDSYQSASGQWSNYTFHAGTPVKVRLQGTLEGILRSSSVDRMESLTLNISELFPELIDVSIVYIPFSCGTTGGVSSRSRSHYCVKAVVNDIESWYSNIKKELSVPWEGFMGIMTFKVTGPVMECTGELPAEGPKHTTLNKW